MTQTIKFDYDNSMTLLNALEILQQTLPDFGVDLEILEGGDGYEEIRLTKIAS